MGHEQMILFTTNDGGVSLDVRMDEDTVCLSLDQMAALFQRDKSTIQFGRDYFRRLPRQVFTRYTVPAVGDQASERVHPQGIHPG